MADGGALTFGLRHVYLMEHDLEHVHSVLKGRDAVVYQRVHALGFEPRDAEAAEWVTPMMV